MKGFWAEGRLVEPTFPRYGRIGGAPLKVDDHPALDLLHQRLQTLVQHPLGPHAVGASCERPQAQTQRAQTQKA